MEPQKARYERIGTTYAATRRTEPRIAARVHAALGDARSVVNVGAGAGSYEPTDREVIAIEPSETMAEQRPPHLPRAIIASAESLPLPDGCADAAMAVLTVHHWSDLALGIAEMRRVARGRVPILTLDAEATADTWMRRYAPRLLDMDAELPPIALLRELMGGAELQAIPSPGDCADLFIETMVGRPELMLDPAVRANRFGFARMDDDAEASAVQWLRADLASGEWDRRYGELRSMPEHDGGLRLLIGQAG